MFLENVFWANFYPNNIRFPLENFNWQKLFLECATFVFSIGGPKQNAGLLLKPISDAFHMEALVLYGRFFSIIWLPKISQQPFKSFKSNYVVISRLFFTKFAAQHNFQSLEFSRNIFKFRRILNLSKKNPWVSIISWI